MKRTRIRGLDDKTLATILNDHRNVLQGLMRVNQPRERLLWAVWAGVVTAAMVYLGVQ